jgi:hypothetical protein
MTKEDMVQVLRSVGVNENTVTAMCNAFDMGVAYEREACAKIAWNMEPDDNGPIERAIRARCEV